MYACLKGFYDSNNSNGCENLISKKNQNEVNEIIIPPKKKIGKYPIYSYK